MPLTAAVASIDITPPVGVELCGYGFYLGRRSTGVRQPLRARALILDDGASQVAIVTCDLIALRAATVADARERIAEATGIPASHVTFACSHTHSGPATFDVRGCGMTDWDYIRSLRALLTEPVVAAQQTLTPATLSVGKIDLPELGYNRVEGDAGPLDRGLVALCVADASGEPLATLYNVTAHCVTHFSSNTLISPDWPGVVANHFAESGGGEAMFMQGSCGDVNPVLVHTGRVEEAGESVIAALQALQGDLAPMDAPTIGAASRIIDLPLDVTPATDLAATVRAERRLLAKTGDPHARMVLGASEHLLTLHQGTPPTVRPTEIQVLRIGDLLMLAHGGELFCEYGLELKYRCGPGPVMVVGYANDLIGYVPDPDEFDRGGYAATTVPLMCSSFPYPRDVGDFLVDHLADLAAEVR